MQVSATNNRHLFPSTAAAIFVGALVTPSFVLGWRFIEATLHSQLAVILWFIVAFLVPVLLATVDLKYAARRRRELGGFFRPVASANEFRLFYIPAWRRMFVWFASTVISVLILKALGVEL
jgi:hypothetical protein